VNILLDENFPLQLYDQLRKRDVRVEHILLQERGIPDSAIRERLTADSQLLLLTQDTEFLDLDFECRGQVIVSRVRQGLPIRVRVEMWLRGLEAFVAERPPGTLFELIEPGRIVPWEVHRATTRRP
jgi:predicted nuclease of predicted toxin-antitoxin system